MDDLAKKFESFETMMTQALDKLSGLEVWRTSAEMATEDLFSQTGRLTSRIQQLEAAPPLPPPPPPPRPATAPPQPPPRWTNPFDLNLAPHPVTRTSAMTGERPSGHRNDNTHRADGGGILGSHPPRPVTGIAFVADPPPDHRELARDSSSRNPHMPKLHFPVFDGDNPRLWRDRCEMYFEVFSVLPSLKTRFAALNFKGVAANWLQTLERKRCVSDWEEFCKAVFEHFDRDQYQTQLRQLDSLR